MLQDDEAKDEDLHNTVCTTLGKNFVQNSTKNHKQCGISILSVSADVYGCNNWRSKITGFIPAPLISPYLYFTFLTCL